MVILVLCQASGCYHEQFAAHEFVGVKVRFLRTIAFRLQQDPVSVTVHRAKFPKLSFCSCAMELDRNAMPKVTDLTSRLVLLLVVEVVVVVGHGPFSGDSILFP